MKVKGFAPYDFLGLQYRPIDDALSCQVDVVFVKEDGPPGKSTPMPLLSNGSDRINDSVLPS